MFKYLNLKLLAVVIGVTVVVSYATLSRNISYLVKPIPEFSSSSTLPGEFLQSEPEVKEPQLFDYIEIMAGCGPYYEGVCVNMRSGPGKEYPVVKQLRSGIVLRVDEMVNRDGRIWYKVGFDENIRYPERVAEDWYVSADYSRLFKNEGRLVTAAGLNASSTKSIYINRTKEMLYAYDGDTLFMKQAISTGLEFTPTPRGTFYIYRKTPSRYMQGPIPDITDQYYDLPGVPWDLYFTFQGGAIHGAYWHDKFGEPWSHGCVNLPPNEAKLLYEWAELGTPVIVRD